MSEDDCQHLWGPSEQVESMLLGEICSPLCKHCGAVKLEEDQRASKRRQAELAARPINYPVPLPAAAGPGFVPSSASSSANTGKPLQTNIPPAGSPAVHPYQSEFAADT